MKLAKDKANLPIATAMDAIVASVRDHPVTVIAGDTGCGKSTQLPQYLIRAGFTRMACTQVSFPGDAKSSRWVMSRASLGDANISLGDVQPRRISAVSLARRVSFETLNEHGDEIAFQVPPPCGVVVERRRTIPARGATTGAPHQLSV